MTLSLTSLPVLLQHKDEPDQQMVSPMQLHMYSHLTLAMMTATLTLMRWTAPTSIRELTSTSQLATCARQSIPSLIATLAKQLAARSQKVVPLKVKLLPVAQHILETRALVRETLLQQMLEDRIARAVREQSMVFKVSRTGLQPQVSLIGRCQDSQQLLRVRKQLRPIFITMANISITPMLVSTSLIQVVIESMKSSTQRL